MFSTIGRLVLVLMTFFQFSSAIARTATGKVEVAITDTDGRQDKEEYIFYENGKDPIVLNFSDPKEAEKMGPGDKVEIEIGLKRSDNSYEVMNVNNLSEEGTLQESSFSEGYPLHRKVLLVRVNYADMQAFMTMEQILAHFEKVKKTYSNSSYNKVFFEQDIDQDGKPDTAEIFYETSGVNTGCSAAKAQDVYEHLTLKGIDYNAYHHVVVFFPYGVLMGCPDTTQGVAAGGRFNRELFGLYALIFNERNHTHVSTTHEVGHNIGWGHAASDLDGDGTPDYAYGDSSSFMAGSLVNAHAINRYYHGYFDATPDAVYYQTKDIETLTISALDIDPQVAPYPQLLKLYTGRIGPYSRPMHYYISFRRNMPGEDINLYPLYLTGATIRAAHDRLYRGEPTAYMKTLSNGEAYNIQYPWIRVTQVASTADTVTVHIQRVYEIESDDPGGPVIDPGNGEDNP